MKEKLMMTPGPTEVSKEVREAMARPMTNPDIDHEFFKLYGRVCDDLGQLLHTRNQVLILSGEGILGLEAACASLIEEGDKVLCLDNGIFGKGFGDFAKMYGGEVTYFTGDYEKEIDVEQLEKFLKEHHEFKLATYVHCETPSGITNPVHQIGPLLKDYGILSVVDAVSSIGGEPLEVDEWQLDVVLGASQKCLSAPPGLTFLSVSKLAWEMMQERKTPIKGFYTNLLLWRYWKEEQWFPYTQPISNIYGFEVAVKRLLEDTEREERHRSIASATRKALMEAGLHLYPVSGYATTVTTVKLPEGVAFQELYQRLLDEGIMIAGAFDFLEGKVFRIGHMGENCTVKKVARTLKGLQKVLETFNISVTIEMEHVFNKKVEKLYIKCS